MASLDSYVSKAREKGISDKRIKQTLQDEGWDDNEINQAMADLSVPKPPSKTAAIHSTGHLQSALHHVLLWFFLGSSSISISQVTASLFGVNVSTSALASLIAVTLVTFTPYVVFFVLFLRQVRRDPKTIPNKVWSIITICLASIGAMISAITLAVSAVTSAHVSAIVASTLTLILFTVTLVVYGFATFAAPNMAKVRKVILLVALPAFAVLMGTLFVLSLLQLGPAKHDETVRAELVKTAHAIKSEVAKTGVLPSAADAKSLVTKADITYTLKSSSTYELCATFETASDENQFYPTYYAEDVDKQPLNDSYLGEYNFYAPSGLHCFVIQSDQLATPIKDKP